ncbi:hypothetical protein [Kitasatospora sp. NPDC089509]|uniref:hypothetical protein n=1 Tax=Kitasatospora sp. NPDC089509 TaxID=3364079 RepID=UPI0037F58B87
MVDVDLRQVKSWLEGTRTAALALRGAEQDRPARPVVRRTRFRRTWSRRVRTGDGARRRVQRF